MSSKKIHLLTIVGTRPEIIRLSSIINRLNKSKSIKHTLVHTGQSYDYNLNEVFFKRLKNIKTKYILGCCIRFTFQNNRKYSDKNRQYT